MRSILISKNKLHIKHQIHVLDDFIAILKYRKLDMLREN